MRRCVKRESAQRSTAVTNRLPLAISSSSVVSRGRKELYAFSLPETATSFEVRLSLLILYKLFQMRQPASARLNNATNRTCGRYTSTKPNPPFLVRRHKCLRICDIWNQSDCLACVLEIHFGVSAKASWRYRVHYRPEDGLRRCPDVQLLLETAMSITRAYPLFPICSKMQAG